MAANLVMFFPRFASLSVVHAGTVHLHLGLFSRVPSPGFRLLSRLGPKVSELLKYLGFRTRPVLVSNAKTSRPGSKRFAGVRVST